MINIEVTGTYSKIKRNKLISAAVYYLAQLNVTKRSIPLDIVIELEELDALGYCDFNGDHKYPEITISLNKNLPEEEMFITLAHELVHAKQYLRKELKSVGMMSYWMGKPSNNLEWEKEAYNLEQQLHVSFKKEVQYATLQGHQG